MSKIRPIVSFMTALSVPFVLVAFFVLAVALAAAGGLGLFNPLINFFKDFKF
jgi:hypothetical protein